MPRPHLDGRARGHAAFFMPGRDARVRTPAAAVAATPAARSSAMPARAIVPSSNSRPISVTPCGTRRGGEKLGSGCAGSGAQSLRASRHVDEAGAQGERRMAGEVGDRQHLVAQRRHQQQVDLRRRPAPSPAPPCGAGGRPARRSTADRKRDWRNSVRPRVGHLHLQLIEAGRSSVSSSNAAARLGEQDEVQRVVRPVGQRDFDRHHARAASPSPAPRDRHRSPAPPSSTPGSSRPAGPRRWRVGVEVELARHARHVARIGPGDRRAAPASRPRRCASSAPACRATSTASSRRCAAPGRRSAAAR